MKNLSPIGLPVLAVATGATTPDPGYPAMAWSSTLGAAVQWTGSSWQPFAALQHVEESRSASGVNATIPAHSLTAVGAESDIDLVLSPKGLGAFSLHVPDGTVDGGNKRGESAVDLQRLRLSAGDVASGAYSTLVGGYNSSCSGEGATVVGGDSNTASGYGATLLGASSCTVIAESGAVFNSQGSTVNAYGGTALGGYGVLIDVVGQIATGAATSGLGSRQRTHTLLAKDTYGADQERMTTGDEASYETQLSLRNGLVIRFVGQIVARAYTSGDAAVWEIHGVIKRGANAAATAFVGTPAVTLVARDSGASTWAIALGADTTYGALKIDVTGQADTLIHWLANIEATEVG